MMETTFARLTHTERRFMHLGSMFSSLMDLPNPVGVSLANIFPDGRCVQDDDNMKIVQPIVRHYQPSYQSEATSRKSATEHSRDRCNRLANETSRSATNAEMSTPRLFARSSAISSSKYSGMCN